MAGSKHILTGSNLTGYSCSSCRKSWDHHSTPEQIQQTPCEAIEYGRGSFSTEFSMTFPINSASAEGFKRLFPPTTPKYDVVFPDKDGNPLAKVIVESAEDMKRIFLEGETLDVDWYRMASGEWEFVERHPFSCKLKK
jgi:hypothetical protein